MSKKVVLPLEKLKTRVEKQFKIKKLIGDIPIDDNEYLLLKTYSKNIYSYIVDFEDSHETIDLLFSVALVQVGLREYDGNYWNHVEEFLDVDKLATYHKTWIGQSYLNTLKYYNKIYIPIDNRVKYVDNILLYTFIANKQVNDFFLFFYKYYEIDLEEI